MKKKRQILIICIAALIAIAFVALAYGLQKNRQTPEERIAKKASETDAVGEDNDDKNQKSDSPVNENEKAGDNVLMIGAVKMEMLSAKVFEGDDISSETEYPATYFKYQTLPDPEYTKEEKDWEAIYEEAPEYKKVHLADYGEYPIDYVMEIQDKYSDVIEKYTTTKTVQQKLYFIKCRLTNLSSAAIEATLPLDVTIVSADTGEVKTFEEDLGYFDKPVYTEGDDRGHKYFWFKLDGKESMECTIGLLVSKEYGDNVKNYYGTSIPSDTEGFAYDPSILPDFIDIDALPRTE